jgi:hypothetical protein
MADVGLIIVFFGWFIALPVSLLVINALKGKWWFALFGAGGVHVLGVVGAIRLAKPHSYWARRWYGEEKMARTMSRFGGKGGRFPGSAPSEAELAAAADIAEARAQRAREVQQEALTLAPS